MAEAKIDRDWDEKYATGDTPWDSGLASRAMLRVIGERQIVPARALELGCGTGTNAIALAQLGFDVTAVDCSARALELARAKAAQAGARVEWVEADVQNFGAHLPPFDFVFDRGCYHCCRRVDLAGYLQTLRNVTRPGSKILILAGNANEQSAEGPPRVSENEVRSDFREFDELVLLREFHFEDAGGGVGPLGWTILIERTP
jgi:SAM-dependent methyltransferase